MISLNFLMVSNGPTDYKSALVQVMAWYKTGDKPFKILWHHIRCNQSLNSGFPQKSQKKSSMIFPWLLQAKIQISRPKIPIFVFAAHVSNCRINYRQTQTYTHHTQTHTWFDQGQSTIQLILLVIELIQEVKTTLVNLIKMGNRFSY